MRSWKKAVLRGTCAMFGNRCCSLLHHHHHRLFPMKLVSIIPSTIIILITVIIGTRVEAIQLTNPSSRFSSVMSLDQHSSEGILDGMRTRSNASRFLVQRLRDLRRGRKSNDLQANDFRNDNNIIGSSSQKRFIDSNDPSSIDRNSMQNIGDRFGGFRFSSRAATITTTTGMNKEQHGLERKSKLLQQTQNTATLTDSPPSLKLIPSNFPRLTNRQDCNGSDCLKNNDAISLYIPRDNSTNDGQPPPLLLLSNNPSSNSGSSSNGNSGNRKNHNPPLSTTLKFSKLHTGIKVLRSDVQHPQKSIPSPDASAYQEGANSRSNGEYGGVKLSEVGPIPPFAGGAELTDFIQPIDMTMQTQRIYENIIPNHISPTAYYDKNKHYLLSASGNRGVYGDLHPAPLIPFDPKMGIYEPVTVPSPHSVYSTYSAHITDHSATSSQYGSQYDLHSVNFNFNEFFYYLIIQVFGFVSLINFQFFYN
uniref:Homeobox protein 2-like n=1 Tax=Elaeophora elaphi TaxID=1147741 RepID=A0A0R3S6K2_9BILA